MPIQSTKPLWSRIAVVFGLFVTLSFLTFLILGFIAEHVVVSGLWMRFIAQFLLCSISFLAVCMAYGAEKTFTSNARIWWLYVIGTAIIFLLYRIGSYPDNSAYSRSLWSVFKPWLLPNLIAVLLGAFGAILLLLTWKHIYSKTISWGSFANAICFTTPLVLWLATINALISYPRTLPFAKSAHVHEQLAPTAGKVLLTDSHLDSLTTFEIEIFSDTIVRRNESSRDQIKLPRFDVNSRIVGASSNADAMYLVVTSQINSHSLSIYTLLSGSDRARLQFIVLPEPHGIELFSHKRISDSGRSIYLEHGRFLHLDQAALAERYVSVDPELRFGGWSGDIALLFDFQASSLNILDFPTGKVSQYPIDTLPDNDLVAALSPSGDLVAYSTIGGAAVVVQSLESVDERWFVSASLGNYAPTTDWLRRGNQQTRLTFMDDDHLVYLSRDGGLATVSLRNNSRIFHSSQGATVYAWLLDVNRQSLYWLEHDQAFRLVVGDIRRMRKCVFPGLL